MKKKKKLIYFSLSLFLFLSVVSHAQEMIEGPSDTESARGPYKVDCTDQRNNIIAYGTACVCGGGSCGRNDCP